VRGERSIIDLTEKLVQKAFPFLRENVERQKGKKKLIETSK
jgi:hypothetical protein